MRKRAERKISAAQPTPRGDSLEAQRLVHELEVHQVELQLQNEELCAARADLEDGLQRYTELFDFAPIGYVAVGPRLEVHELNHAAAELLGQPRSCLDGTLLSHLVAEPDVVRLHMAFTRAEQTGVQQRVEVGLPSGKLVALTIAALDRRRALVALEDVTQRRADEERLARTEVALRQADRRKDEFLAMLSHELRNPLAPIRNSIFLLTHYVRGAGGAASPLALQSLAVMERQVAHMAHMVDDLLDVTRIGRGKIQLRKRPLDLNACVASAVEDQRASFEAAKVSLTLELSTQPLCVDADPGRITQILSNVLGNAEKFTPTGGRVIVRSRVSGGRAELRVRDTGSGIAPEVLGNVFEPFAQAPQTMERSRGGLGLGLSMVKGLVVLHGGTVSIHSAGRGLGTEVVITLPLSAASTAPQPVAAEPLGSARRRVLVIEDNEDAADTLHHALTVVGHEVQVAYDGSSGLELAHQFCPEIVLCDIGLPGMDGYQVARKFREDALLRSAFMIALTGYARPEDLQQALAAGFDEHVAKPPSIERLSRMLSHAPLPSRH